VSSTDLLNPQVIDASTLIPRPTSNIYLPIGIEGRVDAAGTATVGTPYSVDRNDQAVTLFGAASELALLIQAILNRGAGPVIAVGSASDASPTLVQRQAVWELFEADENIRLRLTDSEVLGDLVALATSAKNANLIYNKQTAIVGMPVGSDKADLIAAAGTINIADASRAVITGPGVYDDAGVLRGGAYAAACLAAEIAKNADPSNDLDLWPVPLLTGIELGANGLPVFQRRVVGGIATDDFEDLLQGGVSPLQQARGGSGVQTTHIRTAYTVDGTFDNFYTRVIDDQVFIDVKNYILDANFLRLGNSEQTRNRIKSGVEALLQERAGWIRPIQQQDGTTGYGVTVSSSPDERQVTIGYQGTIVRGISTIQVAANLTIPV
jgi:hypothetical protein